MPKEIVYTDNAPKPFAGYSQAVKCNGFVYVSGTGPMDPKTGEVVGKTIQEQTRQCLKNVQAILEAAGSSLDRAVSATVIMADGKKDFAGMNEEWGRWFTTNPPARQGAVLPVRPKGMKLSIAVIAEV
ncbi:MAG: RidA family protein [Proteobacteria bacterium]|nr:RidA family protein [Pseudomonadota bacterium]